jgi:predicted adenine nucleotide alpha hydrolase (AANH) superfamily ATPase
VKHVLLHACCAPCSPYVLRKLSEEYRLTVFFYNPNIHGENEYELRLAEMRRLCENLEIPIIEGPYDPERFFERVGPLRDTGEGGARCEECFQLRLEETFRIADRVGADMVATTLSVSPHKNAEQINRAGRRAEADGEGVQFFEADFKKQDGYRKTCELAKESDFYRQDFCGCSFSRSEREERRNVDGTDSR